MLENKKDLIISLIKNEIDFPDFAERYNVREDDFDLCKDLETAVDQKDAEAVDLILYLGAVISYEYQCLKLLNSLLLETWHEKHEEIVRLLGLYKSESSVPFLYKCATLNFPYLEYDEDYVLADKCIRLLAKIGSHSALEALKRLSEFDNDSISKKAKKQLARQ